MTHRLHCMALLELQQYFHAFKMEAAMMHKHNRIAKTGNDIINDIIVHFIPQTALLVGLLSYS